MDMMGKLLNSFKFNAQIWKALYEDFIFGRFVTNILTLVSHYYASYLSRLFVIAILTLLLYLPWMCFPFFLLMRYDYAHHHSHSTFIFFWCMPSFYISFLGKCYAMGSYGHHTKFKLLYTRYFLNKSFIFFLFELSKSMFRIWFLYFKYFLKIIFIFIYFIYLYNYF